MAQHVESDKKVRLAWVLVHDELHQVTEFAGLAPRQRPAALCPICREPVTMKLGPDRAHHAAHQDDSECSATHPETALHQNVKFYLAQQLRLVSKLEINEPCVGSGPNRPDCTSRRIMEFAIDWDDVQVEYALNPLRPDIVLLVKGKPIAAIEV